MQMRAEEFQIKAVELEREREREERRIRREKFLEKIQKEMLKSVGPGNSNGSLTN